MPPRAFQGDSLLPLLLSLPAGAVVGVPADPETSRTPLHHPLAAFGPGLSTSEELRHAAARPPVRLVVDIDRIAGPVVEAAMLALREAGVTLVMRSSDRGRLLRLCDRLLDGAGEWVPADGVGGSRRLELRVANGADAAPAWIEIPLGRGEGAEAAMAAARAGGLRVLESRVGYRGDGGALTALAAPA